MHWKLIVAIVIAGVLLGHTVVTGGVFSAMMLFGLMLAGYGLGRMVKERRGQHDDSQEQEIH